MFIVAHLPWNLMMKLLSLIFYDAMKYPDDDNPVYSIDVIDSLA